VIFRRSTFRISSAARLALFVLAFAAAARPDPGPLTVTSGPTLPTATVSVPYSVQLTAAGGCTTNYTWTYLNLPGWVTASSQGLLTGTPVPPPLGTQYTFTAIVSDGECTPAQATLTIPLGSATPTIQIAPANPPSAEVNQRYSYQFSASGASGISWSIQDAPSWLTISSSTGLLSGTPTTPGFVGIMVTATAGQASAGIPVSFTVYPALVVQSSTLPAGVVNVPYSQQLVFSGGASQSYTASATGLPPGLGVSNSGSLSGTPTSAGPFTFSVSIRDTAGYSATGQFSLTVAPALSITSTSLSPANVGVAYSQSLSAAGGSGGYSWSASGLPQGLSLSASGQISGTTGSLGSFSVAVTVRDSSQKTATATLTLTVTPALLITTTSLSPASVGVAYSQSLSASGGSGGFVWSASGLPQGLNLSTSSQISGTPGSGGSFSVTVTVRDSAQNTVSATLTLTVIGGLSITTTSLSPASVGVAYSQSFSASGGSGGYTWSGSGLPQGLGLSTSGQISGTPASAGSFSVNVTVKDSAQNTASATFTLQVNSAFRITTTSLPNGIIGTTYSASLSVSGSVGNVAWSLTVGALPGGLSLASNGAIAGTPTATGDSTFTVQAVDSSNSPVSASFTIHVALPPPSTLTPSLPSVLTPGSQPAITIDVSPAYPLPLAMTATLSISPDLNGATDLGFANGSRTIQFTIPANTPQYQLPFSTGTSAGTITVTMSVDTTGQAIVVSGSLVLTGQVSPQAPVISSVTATAQAASSTLTVVVTGFSSTRDMRTAAFHFTPAAGATLAASDFTVDVSSVFTTWYANPTSFPTGSQFKLTVPFTIGGNPATIASVTVMLTNSTGTSAPSTATIH
jgi:hypothetical protein